MQKLQSAPPMNTDNQYKTLTAEMEASPLAASSPPAETPHRGAVFEQFN
jgi:hypothetical protein